MALKYINIGGSAGSFVPIVNILSSLPPDFPYPMFLCLHRLKHVRKGLVEALSIKTKVEIIEPVDNELIMGNKIYVAPANYHMYFESNKHISLSVEPMVNHSRPSIDISFYSAAQIFKSDLTSILLSGANADGAFGIKQVKQNKGVTIVQNPKECQVDTMVDAALKQTEVDYIFTVDEIISYLLNKI